ncbi:MAG: flagellar biosynthetic protein FliO [Anaerolineaceae bacterium]|nr:flagellar biosynthetic protein FliO [Anaerolineaceae bacterium]
MRVTPEQLQRWLQVWKHWPRWAQVSSLVGGISLVVLVLVSGFGPMDSPAPAESPTLLAFKVFSRLLAATLLILGCFLVLRKWQKSSGRSTIRKVGVVETVHLSQRRALYLVRIGERELLIGGTDQSITFLADASQPLEAAGIPAPISHAIPFEQLLVRQIQADATRVEP